MSKAALSMLTPLFASRLAVNGINVYEIRPGVIATEMVEEIPEKVRADLTARIPLGRFGRPEEVARVVHFLAADASSYITGQVWGINGGLDM